MSENSQNQNDMAKKGLDILLVEDSEADVMIAKNAINRQSISTQLQICENGEDAWQYLKKTDQYENAADWIKPDIIFLDLNMPRMNGFEFLEQIKSDDEFKAIPVIVLTTSSSMRDISESYQLGAASFIQKPVDFENFCKLMERTIKYWSDVNCFSLKD